MTARKFSIPKIAQGARLLEAFSGHPARRLVKTTVREIPNEIVAIGPLHGLLYEARRDGRTEKYLHKFAPHARPLLCASPDGQQVYLIGGSYTFTDRGIVDAPRKRSR